MQVATELLRIFFPSVYNRGSLKAVGGVPHYHGSELSKVQFLEDMGDLLTVVL
jgi:hypothetical protein